jgi:hypothetical protein
MKPRSAALFSIIVLSIFCLWTFEHHGDGKIVSGSRSPASLSTFYTIQCLSDSIKELKDWPKQAPARVESYHLYREKKAKISKEYAEHPDFKKLIKDPDHDLEITHTSLLEAVSGLEAVKQGKLRGPIIRGPAGSEFVDGDKLLWDVKTPISPAKADKWSFNSEEVGHSLAEKIEGDGEMHILLDISYLTEKDLKSLNTWMKDNLSEDQLKKIVSIVVKKPLVPIQ